MSLKEMLHSTTQNEGQIKSLPRKRSKPRTHLTLSHKRLARSPSENTSSEDLIQFFSNCVEAEAEYVAAVEKRNSVGPQHVFEALKKTPIEEFPSVDFLWQQLKRSAITPDILRNAFERDLALLEDYFSASDSQGCRHVAFESTTTKAFHLQMNESMPQPPLKKVSTVSVNQSAVRDDVFSILHDVDDHIYTDSDEEIEQRDLLYAPFIRPLRHVMRRIKQKESLYYKFLAQHLSSETFKKQKIQATHPGEKILLEKKKQRRTWREWNKATRLALWFNCWRPVGLLSLFHKMAVTQQLTSSQIEELRRLKVFCEPLPFPEFKLCQALLLYFAKHFPYLRDSDALCQLKDGFSTSGFLPMSRSPFQWTLWNSEKILCQGESLKCQQHKAYTVQSCFPGTRFYIGRAESIWGSPVCDGYHKLVYPVEVVLWLNRSVKPFVPLIPVFFKKRSPCQAREKVEFHEPDTDSLAGALSLHIDEPIDMSVRIVYEEDSSCSSLDFNDPPYLSCFLPSDFVNYHVDRNVMRLGRFGHLRSCWTSQEKTRRKRQGAKYNSSCVNLPSEDFSSEDSHMDYIESQKFYRDKRRKTYDRIKEQQKLLEQCNDKNLSTESQRKKALYEWFQSHRLGQLEEEFCYPSGNNIVHPCYGEGMMRRTSGNDNQGIMSFSVLERWTYISHKKRRVGGIEPPILNSCSVPLGFYSKSTDFGGSQYHLVGIDQNELWRQFGDSKAFQKRLQNYASLIKGCRDYYAIIDESQSRVTVVPGAWLSLFWVKSAKQNAYDMHWLCFWKFWSLKRFRRRLVKKLFRYQHLAKQGWFVKKSILDKLGKIEDRLREASAFRRAKQTRLSKSYFVGRGRMSSVVEGENEQNASLSVEELLNNLQESFGVTRTTEDFPDNEFKDCDGSLFDADVDLEKGIGDALKNSVTEEAVEGLSSILLRSSGSEDQESCYLRTMRQKILDARDHAFSVNGCFKEQKKIARTLFECYGPVISNYYRRSLPAFTGAYRLAREIMTEKFEAELESDPRRKQLQKRRLQYQPEPSVE